ncbi:inner nuclear membrane protein enriched at telomere/subtelomere region [Mortierella sp. GBA39]|nr:inner nuclear membrane protein enriched at telomere/subtelomere region [Mortierella sp. GBA39]
MAPPANEVPHYLHPDFDPWSIKMNQIRDILIQHNVKTPTGAVRKQQLVDLFNEHIKPDVPELGDSEDMIEHEDTLKFAKIKLKKTNSRAKLSKENGTVETKQEEEPTRGRKPKQADLQSDDETRGRKPRRTDLQSDDETRGRKPRKTDLQSDNESRPRGRPRKVTKEKSNNFSDENPFQSGSESGPGRSRSRTTPTLVRSRSSTRIASRRAARESEEAANQDHVFKVPAQPAFSKFMKPSPVAKEKKMDSSSRSSASPPPVKARQVTDTELPSPKELSITNSQDDKDDMKELKENLRQILKYLWVVLPVIFLAYGIWYRQARFDIGFCTATDELTKGKSWFSPSCIPCPDHATCIDSDADPICPPEYMLKPQLLSFGNLLPLSPICVLNKAKEYQSLRVANAAEQLLQIHAGNVECGMLTRDKAPVNSAEYNARRSISTDDLQFQLEQLKDASIDREEYLQLWKLALKELHRRPDTVVFEHGLANEERIRSLRPRKSLSCRLRQAFVGWALRFKFILFTLTAGLIGAAAVHVHIARRRKEARIVNGLVQNVLAKLSDQAHYYYVDRVLYPEAYLPEYHLRDVLLADVHSPARRQEIWNKVEAVVERNSNVRATSEEVRGELHRVWEWVGSTGVYNQQNQGQHSHRHNEHQHQGNGEEERYLKDEHLGGSMGTGAGTGRAVRGVPKVPPRMGPHGSFFGMRREDSEYLNPENSLYPSLSQQDYGSYSQN